MLTPATQNKTDKDSQAVKSENNLEIRQKEPKPPIQKHDTPPSFNIELDNHESDSISKNSTLGEQRPSIVAKTEPNKQQLVSILKTSSDNTNIKNDRKIFFIDEHGKKAQQGRRSQSQIQAQNFNKTLNKKFKKTQKKQNNKQETDKPTIPAIETAKNEKIQQPRPSTLKQPGRERRKEHIRFVGKNGEPLEIHQPRQRHHTHKFSFIRGLAGFTQWVTRIIHAMWGWILHTAQSIAQIFRTR